MLLNIVGGAYTQPSVELNAQECINWYPVIDQSDARSTLSLYPTAGRSLACTLDSDVYPVQFLVTDDTYVYTLSNNVFYKLEYAGDGTFTATSMGTCSLLEKDRKVCVSQNSSGQIIFSDGTTGYSFDNTTETLAQITDVDFLGADALAYMDGYFFCARNGSNTVYASDIDAITFTGTDISTFNARSDAVVSLLAVKVDLFVFGTSSTEIWYDAGNAEFPFSRRESISLERGCGAALSPQILETRPIWLDQFGYIVATDQYDLKIVSTPAMHDEISKYSRIDDAYAIVTAENGQSFYHITFPSASVTWVYSDQTKAWHKRSYLNPNSGIEEQSLDYCALKFSNKYFVGDRKTGKIYWLTDTVFTDNGDTIKRTRTSQHFHSLNDRTRIGNFSINCESGVGSESLGTAPSLALSVSKDGGHTFGSQRYRSPGKTGQYKSRLRWSRLGAAYNWTFKIEATDPVKWVIMDTYADVAGLPPAKKTGEPNG